MRCSEMRLDLSGQVLNLVMVQMNRALKFVGLKSTQLLFEQAGVRSV